jgi:imidazole glycerol-phosphate synthase subunit HisF
MLLPRIIPCLLMTNDGLVKTIKFDNPNYVGDPINAVKIFNEKKADELILLEIDASVKKYDPNFNLISKIARESRMPICYGGGIKSLDHAKKIFNYGIEKIAISSIVHSNTKIISDISNYAGSQSTIIVLDIKKKNDDYKIFIENGKKEINEDVFSLIKKYENEGMGELVINSIDHDGLMKGYDFDLIDKIFEITNIPLTILGGAGSLADIKKAIEKYGNIGFACGSLFIYKGPRKAVLINYPDLMDKKNLFPKYFIQE